MPLQHQGDGLQLLAHAHGPVLDEAHLVPHGAGRGALLRLQDAQLVHQVLLQRCYHLLRRGDVLVRHGALLGHGGHHAGLLHLQLQGVHLCRGVSERQLGLDARLEVLAEGLVRVQLGLALRELLLQHGALGERPLPRLRRVQPCRLELQVDLLSGLRNLLLRLRGRSFNLAHGRVERLTVRRGIGQGGRRQLDNSSHCRLRTGHEFLDNGEGLVQLLGVLLLLLLLRLLYLGSLHGCLDL
mmetsp:Transcript_24053/g.74752  ORF Transcript_24053/g.74752 Transcript_24053/m.74752 type:complete len:241 (+) Transcript_24053:4843-5565(+)